ncbi:hypothetical protein Goarm_021915 [Gossypium armourianum]|uniref:Uncharacterized protein n=1 Tax=Gossypium armourianum TaxID=34283 RepID=A0A7J9IT52_9ROSI|nr:hypothetical protein [Gossypium armourianum]
MDACLGGKESMGQESNEKAHGQMLITCWILYLAWMLAPWKMWTSTILLRIGLEIHVKNIGTGWAITMARIGTSLLLNKLKFLLIDISHTCLMQRSPIVAMPSWSAVFIFWKWLLDYKLIWSCMHYISLLVDYLRALRAISY